MEPIALVVEEKSVTVSPSNEIEMVIQTKIICLDSYNNILEKRVKIDVEMSVRDQILYQVRKKFATYLTYDLMIESMRNLSIVGWNLTILVTFIQVLI